MICDDGRSGERGRQTEKGRRGESETGKEGDGERVRQGKEEIGRGKIGGWGKAEERRYKRRAIETQQTKIKTS